VSEANVLLAMRFFEDRSQNDLEAFLSFLDPNAEIDFSELDRPYGHLYRGREQIERLFHEMNDGWNEIRFQTSNPLAVEDKIVIDVQRIASLAGGVAVTSGLTAALTMRGARILTFKLFRNRADALIAAGLAD
jgi:hypothetical protein